MTVQCDGDNYIFSTQIGDTWKREIKFTLGEPFTEGTLFVIGKTQVSENIHLVCNCNDIVNSCYL